MVTVDHHLNPYVVTGISIVAAIIIGALLILATQAHKEMTKKGVSELGVEYAYNAKFGAILGVLATIAIGTVLIFTWGTNNYDEQTRAAIEDQLGVTIVGQPEFQGHNKANNVRILDQDDTRSCTAYVSDNDTVQVFCYTKNGDQLLDAK